MQYECVGILAQINRYVDMLVKYELIEGKQFDHTAQLLYEENVLLIGWIKDSCQRLRRARSSRKK